MSATACSPVSRNLSSARPQLMFTLKRREATVASIHRAKSYVISGLHSVEEVCLSLTALK